MTDIVFKIGQEHENMKGAYKVLAVNRDTICICWESGEEVTTTAALQNRIIERMDRERALMRAKKSEKRKRPKLPELVRKFEGLKEDDFTEDVAGATWRYYDGLGGAVAVRLNSDRFDITSWPRYGLSGSRQSFLPDLMKTVSMLALISGGPTRKRTPKMTGMLLWLG
jgi:hypothetical protein